jgi:hypothetical protein
MLAAIDIGKGRCQRNPRAQRQRPPFNSQSATKAIGSPCFTGNNIAPEVREKVFGAQN